MSLLQKFMDQYQEAKRDIANFVKYNGTAISFAKMVISLRNTADALAKDKLGTSGLYNAANNIEGWIKSEYQFLGEHRAQQKKRLIVDAFQYFSKRAEDVGFSVDPAANGILKANQGGALFLGSAGESGKRPSFALAIKFPKGVMQIDTFALELGIPRGAKSKKEYRTTDIIRAGNDLQSFILANFS